MESSAEKYPFLSKEYLESVLRKSCKNDSVSVRDYTVVPALGKGQNYSSDILRVKINYVENGSNSMFVTYIVKASLDSEEIADMIEEYDVFPREAAMYNTILPRVSELLRGIDYKKEVAPTAILVNSSKPKHIIFEDLSALGFEAADRKKGLNYHQLVMVLEKLAQFHAATAYMFSKDESTMQHHHYPNINSDQTHFHPLFRNCMLACAEEAQKWSSIPENVVRKLFRLEKTMMAKGFEMYKPDEKAFNVLCHCDLSVNNVMLKFDSRGNATDCILVDFAIGFFGSPAMDLSYLLFTSSSDDVTTDQFDSLLQGYHSQLVDSLEKLGYDRQIPSLIDIQVEMLRKGFLGVMFVPLLLPLRLIEDTANADLSHLLGSSEQAVKFRQEMFGHPRFQSRMQHLLGYFDRKGYLD